MKVKYNELGYETANARSWRLLTGSEVISKASLVGDEHNAEGQKAFVKDEAGDKDKEAISTKRVTISFRTGEFQLDDNTKQLIDLKFTPIAKAFSNAKIRIEGNTDNVGSRYSNVVLSKKRAQSVANYLINQHGMPNNRFIIIGNGPDKPVPGCESNQNSNCLAKNRRTDFELVSD